MTVSHDLTDTGETWLDIRNLPVYTGQQFTAGHSGNKDLDNIKLTGRIFGSQQDDAALSASINFPVPLPSLWTYYGTNNYDTSPDGARLRQGNSGVYADYQDTCNLVAGQALSIDLEVKEFMAGGNDVSFDMILTNVGGSQVITFPMRVYDPLDDRDYVLRFVTTEAWTTYKIEFDNFVWSGTGFIVIYEDSTLVETSVATWVANNNAKMTTTLYDDTNQTLSALCTDQIVKLFPVDKGDLPVPAALEIPLLSETYALVGGRDYRIVTNINNLSALTEQLSALTVPVLPALADPQVQSAATDPENLVAGAPWNITDTFELNPDRASSDFAGEVRRDGELAESDHIGVSAGDDYTFRARVRIPSTGGATTYTISVHNENDDSVIAFRSQALVDQVPDYFFEEEFTVSVPVDTSTVYWKVVVTVAVPSLYVDGVMLTRDSDGTPSNYYYSTRVGAPAAVALATAQSELDTMYSWAAGAWVGITLNSLITTVTVEATESSLPTGPVSPFAPLHAGLSWPTDLCDQPPVMKTIIDTIQTSSDLWLPTLRPIIQVNKPTKPVLSDWISAYRKSGGAGDIPINGSFRWLDSSQATREYTAESVILGLEVGNTQPIVENGTALLGSTTRIPFNFVNVAKDVLDSGMSPVSYTDGWQLFIDVLRGGFMDARLLWSVTSGRTIQLFLDGIYENSDWVPALVTPAAPSNVIASVDHQVFEVDTIAAGDLDIYWGIDTSAWTPDVFEFCALSAILDPSDALLPLSQVEVYHV